MFSSAAGARSAADASGRGGGLRPPLTELVQRRRGAAPEVGVGGRRVAPPSPTRHPRTARTEELRSTGGRRGDFNAPTMEVGRVKFVYFDYGKNDTVVLSGDVQPPANASGDAARPGDRPYDERGALWYVIAVIFVYSLSMLFLIVTLVKRRSNNKTIDREVSRFLKGLDGARKQAKVEMVLRMRLRWPGNFITPRYGHRSGVTVSASDLEDFPEWPCLDAADPDRSGSELDADDGSLYAVIPAITVHPNVGAPYLTGKDDPDGESEHGVRDKRARAEACCFASKSDADDGSLRPLEVVFPAKYRHRNISGRSCVATSDDFRTESEVQTAGPTPAAAESPISGWRGGRELGALLTPGRRSDDVGGSTSELPVGSSRSLPEHVHRSSSGHPPAGVRRMRPNAQGAELTGPEVAFEEGSSSASLDETSVSSQYSGDLELSDIEGTEVSYDTDT